MEKNIQDTTQTPFWQKEKNKPNGYIVSLSIIVGFAINAILWVITWRIIDAMDYYDNAFGLFVLFALALLIIPIVWNAKVESRYSVSGISFEHAVVQGVFFIFPLMCLPDWSFLTKLIMASLIVGMIVYVVSIVFLYSQFSASMSMKETLICTVMQACVSFSIGTIISLVIAIVLVILAVR